MSAWSRRQRPLLAPPPVAAGSCGNNEESAIYTAWAIGDLDGDDSNSSFELSIGSDAENQLYRAPGFYITAELE